MFVFTYKWLKKTPRFYSHMMSGLAEIAQMAICVISSS
eukprot:COSAG06_NODE_42054_length_385_cov_0.744755_1_plen_37_part_10